MDASANVAALQRKAITRRAGRADAYQFFNVLTGAELFESVEAALPRHRERLFSPTETLSMFLAQALNDDRSCQAAVNNAAAQRLAGGLPRCSTYTGACCRARQRLPLEMVRSLTRVTGGRVLVTSLLCPSAFSKGEVKALYKRRWHIELDLRGIKSTLGMEVLICKTPEMIEKELWIYLLAHNLIRMLMIHAARSADVLPRTLSLRHTIQLWLAWTRYGPPCDATDLSHLGTLIAEKRVGNRPGRIEPRALKRRPKQTPLLTKPRAEAWREVLRNGHPRKPK